MADMRRMFAIRIVRDRAVEALSIGAICGAVVCAGIAGGVEVAGGVAVLAVRWFAASLAPELRELRHDADGWAAIGADGTLVAVEPPVVHLAHRVAVVLEIFAPDRSEVVVLSRSSTPPDELRRLRVRLRAGGLLR